MTASATVAAALSAKMKIHCLKKNGQYICQLSCKYLYYDKANNTFFQMSSRQTNNAFQKLVLIM
jgi:sulfatase maturation enzyme AslB (radical SAM superfamily)